MTAKCKTLNIVSGEESWHLLSDILGYTEEDRRQVLLICSFIGTIQEVDEAAKTFSARGTRTLSAFVTSGPVGHDVAYKARRLERDHYQYHSKRVRLGYDTWHCLMISSRPGLLLNDDDETLWLELSGANYTTPLLRSWMPYVRNKLVERNNLQQLKAVGCAPMLLDLQNGQLDKIVSDGIKYGKLELK